MRSEIMKRWLAGVTVALLGAAPAFATLGLTWYTVDAGGVTAATGGTLTLGATAAQPDAGTLLGGLYRLEGGFWLGSAGASGLLDPPEGPGAEPIAFRLVAGAPNPFADETAIFLSLPEPRVVEIQVLDPSGRVVRRVCDLVLGVGHHRFAWDGSTDAGGRASSGTYWLRVRAGRHETHRAVILVR